MMLMNIEEKQTESTYRRQNCLSISYYMVIHPKRAYEANLFTGLNATECTAYIAKHLFNRTFFRQGKKEDIKYVDIATHSVFRMIFRTMQKDGRPESKLRRCCVDACVRPNGFVYFVLLLVGGRSTLSLLLSQLLLLSVISFHTDSKKTRELCAKAIFVKYSGIECV